MVLAIAIPQAALAAVLAAGLGIVPGQERSRVANAEAQHRDDGLGVGDCVREGAEPTDGYATVGCDDHRAHGTVIAVVNGDATATEGCAQDTDFFAVQPSDESSPARVACLRRLDSDHPGDPGNGGGIYRAGDCVANSPADAGVREVPCNDTAVFETVTARVKTVAECAGPAYRFAALTHGTERILCLGDGPGIASPGECMGDPRTPPVTFTSVDCASVDARAEVLSRKPTIGDCRNVARQTHYVEDPSGLPHARVVCLAIKR